MHKARIFATLLLLTSVGCFGGTNIRGRPDPNKAGSFSSWLALAVESKAVNDERDYEFVVTLRNMSGRDLEVMVQDHLFEGVIRITARNGAKYELYDQEYLRLLLSSVWPDPVVRLSREGRITWKLRLSALRTVLSKRIGRDIVRGGRMLAEIRRAAVIVPGKGFIADNALEVSSAVKIR